MRGNLATSSVLSHRYDVTVIHLSNADENDVKRLITRLSIINRDIVSVVKAGNNVYIKLKSINDHQWLIGLIEDEALSGTTTTFYGQQFDTTNSSDAQFISLNAISGGKIGYEEMRYAIDNNEIIVFTQPILDLQNEKPLGVEMLCRWQHPEHGLLLPYHFFNAINAFNLSLDLDKYMFKNACDLLLKWQTDSATKTLTVSVNINANSLSNNEFIDYVSELVASYNIQRKLLRVEITETGYIYKDSQSHRNITRLQELGLAISLDDFGAGTTILGYLTYLTPNEIKIDRGLINAAFNAENSEKKSIAIKMLLSMIDWITSMDNVQLVVEGIEYKEQAEFLKNHNVKVGQGYLFGFPTHVDQFEENFKNWSDLKNVK
ncbi:hypothetical protein UA32_12650 [Photobacterium angustum]|uniref:EAL domain-containing protein n=1 Tax=Photobacterium angustum TaxID=661 RepID=A0ABX5H152_PHOAN|nr:EAL domain-containing protein [Photobacterium angustum]KJG37794.1 hypothetical protein UA32_12650 [Photobacterium angustum]PSX07064.1 EAL domain-containing protein [Photobacterium angustum]